MRLVLAVCVLGLGAACAGPVPTLSPDLVNTRPPSAVTIAGAATLPPSAATTAGAATLPPPSATVPRPATPTPADGRLVIQVGDYFFLPAYVTVTVGTTVSWHAVGELFHTVVPKDPSNAWRNGVTAGSGSPDFEWTFTRPGTIFYHCDYHPGAMDAILVVVDEL